VNRIRGLAGRVRIGAADPWLTPSSGVVAVAELAGRLGVVEALDEAIGAIKQRDRDVTAGQLLLAVAQTQMLGGDFLVSLDRCRADTAGDDDHFNANRGFGSDGLRRPPVAGGRLVGSGLLGGRPREWVHWDWSGHGGRSGAGPALRAG
jgi:hypothetical protein